tara:strand:- start:1163 stop:1396 length:234 start_codon:yes stop_codon:yes gene_type:complete
MPGWPSLIITISSWTFTLIYSFIFEKKNKLLIKESINKNNGLSSSWGVMIIGAILSIVFFFCGLQGNKNHWHDFNLF